MRRSWPRRRGAGPRRADARGRACRRDAGAALGKRPAGRGAAREFGGGWRGGGGRESPRRRLREPPPRARRPHGAAHLGDGSEPTCPGSGSGGAGSPRLQGVLPRSAVVALRDERTTAPHRFAAAKAASYVRHGILCLPARSRKGAQRWLALAATGDVGHQQGGCVTGSDKQTNGRSAPIMAAPRAGSPRGRRSASIHDLSWTRTGARCTASSPSASSGRRARAGRERLRVDGRGDPRGRRCGARRRSPPRSRSSRSPWRPRPASWTGPRARGATAPSSRWT